MPIENQLDEIMEKEPEVSKQVEAEMKELFPESEAGGGADPAGPPVLTQEILSLRDIKGRPFDPEIHETDATGNPVINKGKKRKGLLRIRRGIWKREKRAESVVVDLREEKKKHDQNDQVEGVQAKVEVESEPQKGPEPQKVSISPTVLGAMATENTFHLGRLIGGPEWEPMKPPDYTLNERDFLYSTWVSYFQAGAGAEVAPGKLLMFALAMYVAPRMLMPVTQKRMSGFFGHLKRFFNWLKVKLRIRVKHGSQSHTGNDGKRQDNSGKDPGGEAVQAGQGGYRF